MIIAARFKIYIWQGLLAPKIAIASGLVGAKAGIAKGLLGAKLGLARWEKRKKYNRNPRVFWSNIKIHLNVL